MKEGRKKKKAVVEVIPTIISDSVEQIGVQLEQMREIVERGMVERVQIDVVDGIFADNFTVSPFDFGEIDWGGLKVDVHLMTKEPIEFLGDCRQEGVKRVFGQIERMSDQKKFVAQTQEMGLGAGLAVDLFTAVEEIESQVLSEIDGVLLLAVKAGFAGQKFNQQVIEKVGSLVAVRRKGDLPFSIGVDGGVNLRTGKQCVEAGADELAVGSYLWQSRNIEKTLVALRRLG